MTGIDSLVPMVFVKSVLRSIEFYTRLGFQVSNTFTPQRNLNQNGLGSKLAVLV